MTARVHYVAEDVAAALTGLGVGTGDVIHLHCQLFSLGRIGGAEGEEAPVRVYDAVRSVIGEAGTLTVPAAFEDYARHGVPYDTRLSPVDPAQGMLSAYLAERPDAWRSYCPLGAVAGVGPLAEEICHQFVGSSFGAGSAWEKLHELDARFCFLGIKPNQALTFLYYVQQRFGVPHLYSKIYETPVFENGRQVDLPITSHVRYLNPAFAISEDAVAFEHRLIDKGIVTSAPVGRGMLYVALSAKQIYDEAVACLREDIYAFLKAPPRFVRGEVPMDGTTGELLPGLQTRDGQPEN